MAQSGLDGVSGTIVRPSVDSLVPFSSEKSLSTIFPPTGKVDHDRVNWDKHD